MDSPGGGLQGIENVAGRGVGLLAGIASLRGGGLLNYMMARERMMNDPGFRAGLAGSPFTAGFFGVGGGRQPGGPTAAPQGQMPQAAAAAVSPSDMLFGMPMPPTPAQAVAAPGDMLNVPGYMPGTPRQWMPNLPPLAPEQALQEQARATMMQGIASNDLGQRAQYKMAAGIPLTQDEYGAALGLGAAAVRAGGAGTTVQLDVPGMKTQVGSPYNFSAVTSEEYPTYDTAAAAASARNSALPPGSPGWRVVPSGRGTFLLAPPPTAEQERPAAPPAPVPAGGTLPAQPPAPVPRGGPPMVPVPPAARVATPPLFAGAVTTTGGAPPTIPTRTNNPGNIKDGPFARSQPGYVGPGPAAQDGGHFAVFDSPDSGFAAMDANLQRPQYQRGTVGEGLSTWSNGGYGGQVASNVGIDPSRPMSSLTPGERQKLTVAMAGREGYQGPLPSAAAPSPAPQEAPTRPAPTAPTLAAPPPPPRRPVAAAPAFDPNAVVPHVVVPAPAPADATVGYPSPAPEPAPGTIVPAPIPKLRAPAAPVAIPGAPPPAATLPAVPVDPNTGLPLQSRTYESKSGNETFTAPPRGDVHTQLLLRYNGITDPAISDPAAVVNYFATEQALKNNESMDKATIDRMQRGMTEGESKEFTRLTEMKTAINDFVKAYPNASDRAQFLGLINAPLQTLRERFGWQDAQTIRDFRNAFSPFSLESLTDEKGKPVPGMEGLAQMAPSVHDSAGAFESNLQHFNDALDRRIAIVTNLRGMPVGQATPELVDSWVNQLQHDSLAQRLSVFPAPSPAPAGPPAAVAAPPPSAPPPSAASPPPWQPSWVR